MIVQETETLFHHGSSWADVCVVVPLYNYEKYITQTLQSVASQELADVSLVVVDDCSKDSSPQVVRSWLEANKDRFRTAVLARNVKNAGLSITRNTGISIAESADVFFLRRRQSPLSALPGAPPRGGRAKARAHQGAYSLLEMIDGDRGIMGTEVFHEAGSNMVITSMPWH